MRKASLQREWTRAFSLMLLLILTTAVTTLVGLRALVDQVQGPGRQFHLESDAIANLRNELVKNEQIAHRVLTALPVDRPAFLREQLQLSREFDRTAEVFPIDNGMRDTVVKAKQSWQSGLTTYGLWGDQVKSTLKRFGVRIAMDDFGTGFSSLSTLAALPIGILKIDLAFVPAKPRTSCPSPCWKASSGWPASSR